MSRLAMSWKSDSAANAASPSSGGSPADCVVAGMTHILRDRPADVVLSGVNAGQNLGDIINVLGHGGRRARRRNAGRGRHRHEPGHQLRSTASDVDWSNSRHHGEAVVRAVIAAAQGRNHYYNVNFPFCDPALTQGIAVVPHQRFSRSPFRYYQSDNAGKFFVAIPETPLPLDCDSDFQVLRRDGFVTVTPMLLQQSDMDMIESLKGTLTL